MAHHEEIVINNWKLRHNIKTAVTIKLFAPIIVISKYKKKFYIELVNNWSKPGWIYTGADYIFQIFQPGSSCDENYGYVYKREDMVNFINRNKPLFSDKYCKKFPDSSKLWEVYKTRLKDMNFLKKVKL